MWLCANAVFHNGRGWHGGLCFSCCDTRKNCSSDSHVPGHRLSSALCRWWPLSIWESYNFTWSLSFPIVGPFPWCLRLSLWDTVLHVATPISPRETSLLLRIWPAPSWILSPLKTCLNRSQGHHLLACYQKPLSFPKLVTSSLDHIFIMLLCCQCFDIWGFTDSLFCVVSHVQFFVTPWTVSR